MVPVAVCAKGEEKDAHKRMVARLLEILLRLALLLNKGLTSFFLLRWVEIVTSLDADDGILIFPSL
jgi:hypothetical protein